MVRSLASFAPGSVKTYSLHPGPPREHPGRHRPPNPLSARSVPMTPSSLFTLSVQQACNEILDRLQDIERTIRQPDAERVLQARDAKGLAAGADLVRRMTQKVERVRQSGGNRVHIVF